MDFGIFTLMGTRSPGAGTREILEDAAALTGLAGVEEIRRTGVNHISLYFQLGDFPHKKAMRSLERFIGEVVPGIEREIGPLAAYPPADRRPLPDDAEPRSRAA